MTSRLKTQDLIFSAPLKVLDLILESLCSLLLTHETHVERLEEL